MDNEYLERLTETGPRRLHVLYEHMLSTFNAYNMNARARARTHTRAHARSHARTHARTQYNVK